MTTDLSTIATDRSRVRALRAGADSIEHTVVDISKRLPYEDKLFDVVFSNLGLHYFNDNITRSVFKEIDRVLEPGGVLAILLNNEKDPFTKEMIKIEDHFYRDEKRGIEKSYFSTSYLSVLLEDHFEEIVLDEDGSAPFKDNSLPLIRYIGRKKN